MNILYFLAILLTYVLQSQTIFFDKLYLSDFQYNLSSAIKIVIDAFTYYVCFKVMIHNE